MIYVQRMLQFGLPLFPIIWLHFGMRSGVGSPCEIGISTHNPRNEITFNANRAMADPALRLFPSQGKCDFVVDWAADPTWGPDAAAANQTFYPDGTHPSQDGQSNMEANYFRPALNALFPGLT